MSKSPLAVTPEPPYFAVIFTSRQARDSAGYAEMAARMMQLAAQQPGFLGVDSARDADGVGITVSYWQSETAIADWRRNAEHQFAQRRGREAWYDDFVVRVARVERAYCK
jgi:heme-degrading monooxygenase HmoA